MEPSLTSFNDLFLFSFSGLLPPFEHAGFIYLGSGVVSITPYVAGGFLGGNEQIVGVSLEARQYFHLWKDSILVISGTAASVDTWGDGTFVHIYDRLFLGGSNDLRGFDFRDVSPRDITGEPVGGQSLAAFTIEYTMPIIEKARFAVFFDSGFVNRRPWDFDANDYVEFDTQALRSQLRVRPDGPVFVNTWHSLMDQVWWDVEP